MTLFLFFILLIIIGMTLDYRRDLVQQSPGFGEHRRAVSRAATLELQRLLFLLLALRLLVVQRLVLALPATVNAEWLIIECIIYRVVTGGGKDEPIAPRMAGEGPGIDLPQGPPRGPERLTSTESTEPFLIFPQGQQEPPGVCIVG